MNIVFASDNNGVEMLAVAIFSIIKSNPKEKLHIFIINAGISQENQQRLHKLALTKQAKITILEVDNRFFDNITPANKQVPRASYYRYLAPSLLPNENRALYMDLDMLCVGSLKELYETNLKGNYVGGVEDRFALLPDETAFKAAIGMKESQTYVNSGCILMDLEAIRSSSIMDTFWDNVKNRKKIIPEEYDKYNDQTLFNMTFKDKLTKLDARYNTLTVTLNNKILDDDFVILHFAGVSKPLIDERPYQPEENSEYYSYYHYFYSKCKKALGEEVRTVKVNTEPTSSSVLPIEVLNSILAKQSAKEEIVEKDEKESVRRELIGALHVLRAGSQSILIHKIVVKKRKILDSKIKKQVNSGEKMPIGRVSYGGVQMFGLKAMLGLIHFTLAIVFKIGNLLQSRRLLG